MTNNELRGNPGQRRPVQRAFAQAQDKPPEWIDRQAKSFWKRFTPALRREGILNEAMTLLLASHDTTATAVSWCLYALAIHPDIDQRVAAEV
jgi:cytochrome P450